jgi:hypothetical protein
MVLRRFGYLTGMSKEQLALRPDLVQTCALHERNEDEA